MRKIKISPSLMCANLLNLQKDLDAFKAANIDYLHVDIMDGHYVPNFTLGADFCRQVAGYSNIPLDIHLMVENVDNYITMFSQFNSVLLSFHPDAVYHPQRTLQAISQSGAIPALAMSPSYTLDQAKELLPYVKMVCVMTVNPGYAGQKIIPETLKKLESLRDYIENKGYDIDIEVDGNVSWDNIPAMISAGANILVAGTSSVFSKNLPLEDALKKFKDLLAKLCVNLV